jgi:hypothetical protein
VLGAEPVDVVQVYSEGKMGIAYIMVVLAAGSFLIAAVGLCMNITKERRERGITTSPPPCSF